MSKFNNISRNYIIIISGNNRLAEEIKNQYKGYICVIIPLPYGSKYNNVVGRKTINNNFNGSSISKKKKKLYNFETGDITTPIIMRIYPNHRKEHLIRKFANSIPVQVIGIRCKSYTNSDLYNIHYLYPKNVLPPLCKNEHMYTKKLSQFIKNFFDKYIFNYVEIPVGRILPPSYAPPKWKIKNGWDGTGWIASTDMFDLMGDCPDANYFTSEGVCLTENDYLIALGLNHTKIKSSIYTNYNIYSKSHAASVAKSINDHAPWPDIFTISIFGRKKIKYQYLQQFTSLYKTTVSYNILERGYEAMDTDSYVITERVYLNRAIKYKGKIIDYTTLNKYISSTTAIDYDYVLPMKVFKCSI